MFIRKETRSANELFETHESSLSKSLSHPEENSLFVPTWTFSQFYTLLFLSASGMLLFAWFFHARGFLAL
jgi:hypothetical protein